MAKLHTHYTGKQLAVWPQDAAEGHGRWHTLHWQDLTSRSAHRHRPQRDVTGRHAALQIHWWCCSQHIRRNSLVLLVIVIRLIIAEVFIVKVLILRPAPVAIQRARRQVRRAVRLRASTGLYGPASTHRVHRSLTALPSSHAMLNMAWQIQHQHNV